MKVYLFVCAAFITLLSGCANDHQLGYFVNQTKAMQIYNPDAAQENMDVIPDGNGEHMESVYGTYTGKKSEGLAGSSSQVLTGFN